MEHIRHFKLMASTVVAFLTALWGWFGWLIVAWFFCMALDYVTGSAAALKTGEWTSGKARDGLWHKAGCITAVLVSGVLDLVVGHIISRVRGVILPFDYTVFLCPLVVMWYILTEAGSIVENAGALGAPIPVWLGKAIAALRDKVDTAREDA